MNYFFSIVLIFQKKYGVCRSLVLGSENTFNESMVGEWLEVPTVGFGTYYIDPLDLEVKGVGRIAILQNVGGNGEKNTVDHNSLSPLQKLFYNVVWRSIVPRTLKRSTMSLLDATKSGE